MTNVLDDGVTSFGPYIWGFELRVLELFLWVPQVLSWSDPVKQRC
jgi:hypothetical protein